MLSLSGPFRATPAHSPGPHGTPSSFIPYLSDAAVELVSSSHSPALSSHAPGGPGPPLGHVLLQPQPIIILREMSGAWGYPTALGCLAAESITRSGPSVRVCPSSSTSTPYASECFPQPRADSLSNHNESAWSPELVMSNLTQTHSVPAPSVPVTSHSQFVLPALAPCPLGKPCDNPQQLNLPSDANLCALSTCSCFHLSQFQ